MVEESNKGSRRRGRNFGVRPDSGVVENGPVHIIETLTAGINVLEEKRLRRKYNEESTCTSVLRKRRFDGSSEVNGCLISRLKNCSTWTY